MITITIPGKPYAKKRHRSYYNKNMGRAVSVNPEENRMFEDTVRSLAVPAFRQPIEGAVQLDVTFIFAPAVSWSKKRRADRIGQLHVQKPDTDNLIKAVKDGLNRIAWRDDAQVAIEHSRKVWGEVAETIITVSEVSP